MIVFYLISEPLGFIFIKIYLSSIKLLCHKININIFFFSLYRTVDLRTTLLSVLVSPLNVPASMVIDQSAIATHVMSFAMATTVDRAMCFI